MDSSVVIKVDMDSPTPTYRQIINQMRAYLVSGRLQPGDQLPTVRRLAFDLGVHHNTVAQAYRELASEGWLNLCRGRGAIVTERISPRESRQTEPQVQQQLRELIAQARAQGLGIDRLIKILEELQCQLREVTL